MSISVSFGGVVYTVPEPGDANTQSLTDYLNAISTKAIPYPYGGNDVDLGASLGIKSLYFKSRTANPAASGAVRLATTDSIGWRNTANGADLLLGHDTGDALTYNGANVTGNPYLGANQTIATSLTSSAYTIVVFNVVETDTDGGYNNGTGRYTIPTGKGGRYLVSSTVQFNPGASSTSADIAIFKNAANAREGDARLTSASTGNNYHVSGIVNCAVADVLDVRVLQTTGGPINTAASAAACWLTIHRLVG
jgi:hypothetical protein